MYHGEVYAIREWSSVCRSCDPSVGPPAAADSIFLATHEPCCMCISSIVWSGFKRCYYLFVRTRRRATRGSRTISTSCTSCGACRAATVEARRPFRASARPPGPWKGLPLIGALEDGGA